MKLARPENRETGIVAKRPKNRQKGSPIFTVFSILNLCGLCGLAVKTLFAIRRGYPRFVVGSPVESGPQEASMSRDEPSVSLPLACEDIVDLYLKDVDRSLIRENLRLTYTERLQRLQRNIQAANRIRGAGIRSLKIER